MNTIYAMYPEATRQEIAGRVRDADEERRHLVARRHLPRSRSRLGWTMWR
ncbi:hypothetical protein [Nocardioides marmoribigeumensis]|uniref:Uncharacterized protein n=1 Tax=Nocardioides marmoribigeumensis TaxID=433649 RepID=A0ABU2BU13_9ACTN|nr:hypothetical protein [Nocardioides marmoribigeumensis]MDR7362118.1 hypothetical protein [Nocardioides marmoribigeumensis]